MTELFLKYSVAPLILILCTVLPGCVPAKSVEAQSGEEQRRIPVSVTAVQERTFEERIVAQGTLLAKNYAMAAARVDGIITDIFVEEGDRVEAGKTPLFQIDKVVLLQAFEIAVQDKAVAECARLDGEAQVVAAQAHYDKAKLDYDRFTRLKEQQAITTDAMEQMEAGFTVATAQLNRAQTAVKLFAEQEKKAAAALAIAQKRLDDSLVYSPINGIVSSRSKKEGEFAGAGTSVMRITDVSLLEASAFLPGEYYPRLKTGETQMRAMVSGIDLGLLTITYKSPEIQEQLRTFEVKCLVESPPEGVAPGAIAQVEAVLQTHTGPGIPHDIIQVRASQTILFVAENDRAKAIEIKTGLSSDGWTEVLEPSLLPGTLVVTQGHNLVNDGTPIFIQREEK